MSRKGFFAGAGSTDVKPPANNTRIARNQESEGKTVKKDTAEMVLDRIVVRNKLRQEKVHERAKGFSKHVKEIPDITQLQEDMLAIIAIIYQAYTPDDPFLGYTQSEIGTHCRHTVDSSDRRRRALGELMIRGYVCMYHQKLGASRRRSTVWCLTAAGVQLAMNVEDRRELITAKDLGIDIQSGMG